MSVIKLYVFDFSLQPNLKTHFKPSAFEGSMSAQFLKAQSIVMSDLEQSTLGKINAIEHVWILVKK